MDRVARQVQLTQQVLSTPDAEWSDVANSLDELAQMIETLGLQEPLGDVARQLLPISNELGMQITGFRSKLVGQVCAHVMRIVKVLQRDFRALANELLPALARTAKGASTAVRQPGAQLFTAVTEHVRYDLQLFRKLYAQSQHEKIRVLMLEQVAVVLARWHKHEVEPHYSDVVEILKRALQDPAQQVRSASRDALCTVSALWEERAPELVDLLSPPARDLLLKEKPLTAISRAVLAKYPELARRTGRAAASNKTLAKHRTLFQKSASSVSGTDPQVEILVATPPQAKTRLVMLNDSTHSSDASAATASAAVPRRLFQDDDDDSDAPDSAVGARSADSVSASAKPPVGASGVPRPSPSKVSSLSDALASPSSIPAPPASTRPDDAFRRSRTEGSVEGSKIPLLSTRSPIPRSQAASTRVFGIARSHDSPPVASRASPSSIPRRAGSTTAASIGSLRPPILSPLRRAMSFAAPATATSASANPSRETHRTGQENRSTTLNAPDEFLDSPIPSSAPSPTPLRVDSNVTVRARRKVITRAISSTFLLKPSTDVAEAVGAVDTDGSVVASSVSTVEHQSHGCKENPTVAADANTVHAPVGTVSIGSTTSANQGDASLQQEQEVPASSVHTMSSPPLSPIRQFVSARQAEAAPDTPASATDEPCPPSITLGSAVFDRELPQSADDRISIESTPAPADTTAVDEAAAVTSAAIADVSASVEPERCSAVIETIGVITTATAAATTTATTTATTALVTATEGDVDVDIDETMFISRDYTTAVPDTVEYARAAEATTDALPRNALENLIGIQKTMMTLQALTKVDVRDMPFKPRADRADAVTQQRPRSAGRAWEHVPESSPRARTSESWVSGGGDIADSLSAFTAAPSRDIDAVAHAAHRELTVDTRVAAAREHDVRHHNVPSRALPRPLSARRRGAVHQRSDAVEDRTVELPGHHSPRISAQQSAAAERERVEQQFQGLVRESAAARRPRPSSAQQGGTNSNNVTAALRTPVAVTAAVHESSSISGAADVSNTLDPPIRMTVRSASAVASRDHSVAHDGHNARARHAEPQHDSRLLDREQQHQNQNHSHSNSWVSTSIGYFSLLLAFVFGASGLLRAATTVRDSHDYHDALKARISAFEASISESYSAVRKLEDHYGVWSEYVRVLADEDEAHAIALLETLQHEVAQWQSDLKHDLAQFKQALAVDIVDAALAPLLQNASRISTSSGD